MPYAAVNGQRLYYEVGGDGDVIVLLHGFLASLDMMEAPATGLGSGFRALRVERRGHGRSSPAQASVSLADEAKDILALLDWFSCDAAHFVAHDNGAEVALEFALTYPTRTRSVALLSPELDGNPMSPEAIAAWRDLVLLYRMDPQRALNEKYFPQHIFDAARERDEEEGTFERISNIYLKAGPSSYYSFDPAPRANPRHIQRLGELKAPFAVLIGERDEPDRIRAAAYLARGVPGAQFFSFPGLSRFLHIEDSRAVMRRLNDFFMPEPEFER
ncbi:MAG: alpha/beta hydrolase [Acidobacteria bacterium]|nr:alpha/beta hydrolase [Acidobacteriota bacterium]MCK6685110.1 alpha/beta hydrolase [Thermoanaerobaculia bacterium]